MSKFDVDPMHCVLIIPSTLSDGSMKDAVLPSQCCSNLCALFIGSTDVKNTVCVLLKFCPPDANLEFVIDCKFIAHPT